MTEEQPRRRTPRQVPEGLMALAERARALGMSVAALRRFVKMGAVTGRTERLGNRLYVAPDLTVTRQRRPRGSARLRAAAVARRASLTRRTNETRVSVEVNLDGRGRFQGESGNRMLDHFLAQLARHGLLDLSVTAQGDDLPDAHHLVEDVAIVLGRALRQAIGEGRGIRRIGDALVPLDEALAQVAVDVGGRGYAVVTTDLHTASLGDLPGSLVDHFLERLALEGGLNLHARIVAGNNPHHKAEALFKALARALRDAVAPDARAGGEVPSTKGTISG